MAPQLGLYSDQKWLNYLFKLSLRILLLLKNPGLNLGYWNISNRKISKQKNTYFVDDEPLVFFHFSGVDINLKDKLSRHSDFSIKKNKYIKEILGIYKKIFLKLK